MARYFRSVAAGKIYQYERFKSKTNNPGRNRNNKNGALIEVKILRKYTPGIVIRFITFKIRYNSLGVKSLKRR